MTFLKISLYLLLFTTCTVQSEVKCGERKIFDQKLISLGSPVSLGKWPWHAGVFHVMTPDHPMYACGGTIISSFYILTAAHCTFIKTYVRQLNPAEIMVRVGKTSLMLHDRSSQQRDVARIIRHLEYHPEPTENDIALLKLAWMLKITNYVIPICLWKGNNSQSLIVGQNGIVVGWGKDEDGTIPDQLNEAIMPIAAREDCRKSDKNFYPNYLFNSNNFCAGFRNGTSVGPGDSGGGLYIDVDGKWMLRGIVSTGKLNSVAMMDAKSYVVFTDVACYLDWINRTMETGIKASTEDYKDNTIKTINAVCGKKSQSVSNSRIQNMNPWPWQGQVFKRIRKWFRLCDVVIISDSFLLSPAKNYTIEDVQNPSKLIVRFINDKGQTALERKVKTITRHEDFLENNISILEVTEAILYTHLIQPICLGKSQPTTEVSGSLDYVETFQAPILDCPFCERFPTQSSMLKEQLSCYQVDMLNGFRSPPNFVYAQENGLWYLSGIKVNTTQTFSPNISHVLTLDISYFKNWIEEKMNLLGIHECFWRNLDDWNLSVNSKNEHQCFASPISPSLLLTTAVCVDGKSLESLSVVKENGKGENIKLKKINLHPDFNNLTETNNIAVLELEKPFGGVGICLPRIAEDLSSLQLRVPILNENLPTVGFTTSDTEDCAESSSFVRKGIHIAIDGSHICGLMEPDIEEEFESQCSKDFYGAPLLYTTNDGSNVYLRGILDIAKDNHCEDFDTPEVYLDVMHYADWISSVQKLKNAELIRKV